MSMNLIIPALFLPVLLFLIYLIFFYKRVNGIILLIIGLYPLVILYAINPKWRFFSNHGLWHTAIVYRIAGGEIPPSHPFLAGEPLHYCWGNHLIVSTFLKVLGLAPSYSFALINTASLALAMILIFKISRRLLDNERANIFSVITALFGFTFIHPFMFHGRNLFPASIGPFRLEFRGIPVFEKFCNVNSLPVGLIFFLLYLLALIAFFQDRVSKRAGGYLTLSILGCGFFYSPFLPGLGASTVFVCLAQVCFSRAEDRTRLFKKSLVAGAILLGGLLLLAPYLIPLHSGLAGTVRLVDQSAVFSNLATLFLASAPVLILIGINPGFIKNRLAPGPLITVISVTAANIGCYLSVHSPRNNEYLFMILSTVTLGILGGAAWYAFQEKFGRWATFILLLIFLTPFYFWVHTRADRYKNVSPQYTEEGGYLHSNDREEEELNRWVRDNTPGDCMIIDSVRIMPLLTGRSLFYPIRLGADGGRPSPGPGFAVPDILLTTGHDPDLVRKRRSLVRKIYVSDQRLSEQDRQYLSSLNHPVYVIARSKEMGKKLEDKTLQPIFSTFHNRFTVYRFRR